MMKSATTKLAWVFLSWLVLNPSAAMKFNQTGPRSISERLVANDTDNIEEFFKYVTKNATSRIHLGFGVSEMRGVPAIGSYQRIWNEKYSAEQHTPLQPSVQLVLGVFAFDFENVASFEAVEISTWMKQAGVCPASAGQQQGCSVYVAFVFGAAMQQQPVQHQDWRIRLDFPEGMNNGKTHAWFKYAVESFPWATHFGKKDMDAYPRIPQLVGSLAQNTNKSAYIGVPLTFEGCGGGPYCPPKGCGAPMNGALKYAHSNCWSYMQGGLYILSSSLAKLVVPQVAWKHEGIEDLELGKAVHATVRSLPSSTTVASWNPEAWDHALPEWYR